VPHDPEPPGLVYRRTPAPPGAQDLVEHVWTVRAPGFAEPRREILIPTGRPAVVVCLADPGVRHDPLTGTSRPNGTVAFGTTTRPHVLEQRGPSWYVGAQLTPWGLSALSPGRLLVDDVAPLADLLGEPATRALADALPGAGDEETAALVADALLRRATALPPERLDALRTTVAAVDTSRGTTAVAELASAVGRSTTWLYRLHRAHLGIGPKQLCEVVRYFHFAGELLARHRGDSQALLAHLSGYYDQAHAARDFRRFTGTTPTAFRRVHNGIARLMHAHDPSKTG
jgi:AraC-like DNA-binding protein